MMEEDNVFVLMDIINLGPIVLNVLIRVKSVKMQ